MRVGAGWDHDGSAGTTPPSGRGRRGVGGAETPTPASKRGGCSVPGWLATCPRRSRYPSLAGFKLMWSVPTGRRPSHETPVLCLGELVSGQDGDQAPEVWLGGLWQRCEGCVRAWRPCGPIVPPSRSVPGSRGRAARGPHRDCSRPDRGGRPDQHDVAASGPGRGAALAASPPSSHPPPSRAAGSGDGNDSSGNQRAESSGRPDKRDGKAQKDRAGGKDKPDKGKAKGK